jgi:hypothetical protein
VNDMFDESFEYQLKIAASFGKGILAGADITGEMPLEMGVDARRSDNGDMKNIAIGGGILGGLVTGPATPALVHGTNKMNRAANSLPKGTSMSKRLSVRAKAFANGTVDGFKDAYKAPFKKGIGKGGRIEALVPFILGAASQAAMSANQYRLGRKMRNKVESDVAAKGFSGWWRRQMEAVPKID